MTDYVAIVKKCEGDIVYTVEGNTSTTVNGNSVRGVWQHQYPIVASGECGSISIRLGVDVFLVTVCYLNVVK